MERSAPADLREVLVPFVLGLSHITPDRFALGSGCIAPPDHWLSIPLSKGPTVYRAVTSPLLPVPFHGEL